MSCQKTVGAALFNDRSVERLENDGDEIVALGALDLLEGLNIVVLRPVHDGKNFGDETLLAAGPLTGGTNVS